MSGFLLDTSVLSAFAPDRPALPPIFQEWMARVGRSQQWFIPVIAVAETQKGVAKLRRARAIARAERLESWLQETLTEFGTRVVPLTVAIARRVGDMEDSAISKGKNPGLPDILIAATAVELGLTVLTTNTRHFDYLDTVNINPFVG